MFNRLYKNIKVNILNDWLKKKEAFKLLIATTNNDRNNLLEILTYLKNIYCNTLKKLVYFHKYNIKIYSLKITNLEMLNYVSKHPEIVRYIKELYMGYDVYSCIFDNNDCIENLIIQATQSNPFEVQQIIKKYNLKRLHIQSLFQVDHCCLKSLNHLKIKSFVYDIKPIAENCFNLISIDIVTHLKNINLVIENNPNLEEITLNSRIDIANVVKPKKLKSLHLNAGYFSRTSFDTIKSYELTALSIINPSKNLFKLCINLRDIFRPNLRYLNLQNCRIDYEIIIVNVLTCEKLEKLGFTAYKSIEKLTCVNVLENITWINELFLSN